MNQGDLALESTQLLDSMARDVPESIHMEKEVGRVSFNSSFQDTRPSL